MKKLQPVPQIIIPESPLLVLEQIKSQQRNKDLYKIRRQDPLKIVYFGTPEFSAYILEKLIEFSQNPPQDLALQSGIAASEIRFEVQTVVTSCDKPVGRLKELRSSAVSLVAEKYGIPTFKPEKLDEDFITTNYSLLTADLFIVASYGKIIPQALLDMAVLGAINVHGSILPKYRGASPIQAAILNGENETGITIMLMDEKMDHGPILTTKKISITDNDTFDSLSRKMSQESVEFLIKTAADFVLGRVKPRPQNHKQATFCKLLKKEDGYFEIDNPPSPEKLDRMIRAYYPWPNAWTLWKGKIIKLLPDQMVQMEGKKAVRLADFLRGYADFPLKSL